MGAELVLALNEGLMDLPAVAIRAQQNVVDHLLGSETLLAHLEGLPKGSDTFCPQADADQLRLYLAIQKGRVPKDDPALTVRFIDELVWPAMAMEQRFVVRAMMQASDITPHERALIQLGVRLTPYFNILWKDWFEMVGTTYQSLSEPDQEEYKKWLDGQLNEFDYTVFGDDGGDKIVNRQTWAQAFPDVIGQIDSQLADFETGHESVLAFLEAMRRALICTEIDKLEELWADVDRIWIDIPDSVRVLPVHGIENGYEHPFCISPDFRVLVRTKRWQEMIAQTRGGTVEHAHRFGLDQTGIGLVSHKLERLDIGNHVDVIRSGVCANFRAAGQVLPNRQAILAEGGKIFLMSSPAATQMYQRLAIKHCVPGIGAALAPHVTDDSMVEHTTGHECGHPVGRSPEIDEALRAHIHDLDEAKASIAGLVILDWIDKGRLGEEERRQHRLSMGATCVARILRFMQRTMLENPVAQPYVNENLVVAKIMFRFDLITLTEEGLSVDLERLQNLDWGKFFGPFIEEVVAVYLDQDVDKAAALVERYRGLRESGPVHDLIKWVNR